MNKISPCILLLIVLCGSAFSKTTVVHNEDEFTMTAKQAQPGDVITIANGNYAPWAVTLSAGGTQKQPITINAQTPGKVIFGGSVTHTMFLITGHYVTLNGITFSGCNLSKADGNAGVLIDLKNTQHSHISNCLFEKNSAKVQFMPLVIISGTGEHNQVNDCKFTGNIDNVDVQVKITKEAYPKYTLINNNLFKDKNKVSWKVFNGGECIQIGQDPVLLGTAEPKCIVRNNRFIRCNGEGEVISNKSSGNQYKNNYFEDCQGELVMRGGHNCIVDSNQIKGGNSGIRINGTGHIISNNIISDVKTGIRLMYGMAKGKTEIGFYIAAGNCVVKNNHISNATTGILVGDNKNEDWTGKFDTTRYPSRVMQDVAPADNNFDNNKFINVTRTIIYQ